MTATSRRFFIMLALVTAGEAIFFLPFVIARIFRPTLLDVFQINNFELGTAFSAYGFVAMAAYFFGGPLADRFSARALLPTALAATAAGGFVMASIPSLGTLKWLYGFWGLTTILLFWAALMRATREWGRQDTQGSAFGWLDGGRGLMSALIGTLGVAIFAQVLPEAGEAVTLAQRTEAFRQVILAVSGLVLAVALLVWLVLPRAHQRQTSSQSVWSWEKVKQVIRMPNIWLQALLIICAYVGYKGTDDFSLYAQDVMGLSELDAAQVGTISLWVRPFAAVLAGLAADRIGVSRMTMISFILLLLGSLVMASGWLQAGLLWAFFGTLVVGSVGVYALRGLYFAIMEEGRIPVALTGTAVGIASVLGYTPDIFMGPIMGLLLDGSPGPTGHQHVFMVVGGFALLGLVVAMVFARRNAPQND